MAQAAVTPEPPAQEVSHASRPTRTRPGPSSCGSCSSVIIPRSAVIRFEGSDWAYVRHGADGFERRRLDSPTPGEAGLFVTRGFSSGDELVVQGAAELFGAEQNQGARPR